MKNIIVELRFIAAKLAKRNSYFRWLVKSLRKLYKKAKYFFCYYMRYRVEDNVILFESFKGKKYCDSPRAIYEKLSSDATYPYVYIWAFTDIPKKYFSEGKNTKSVRYDSKEYLESYAKAKYIITNSIFPISTIKKKNQIYIQTWHGTPLKRLGCDIEVDHENPYNTVKEIKKKYRFEARMMNYLLSPSAYATEKFTTAFDLKKYNKQNIVVEQGYPRNDYLAKYNNEDIVKIKERLNIPSSKKIILYAPTYRDNSHQTGMGYTYFPEINFELLQKELADSYIILYRAHYFIVKSFDFEKYKGFVLDVSDIDDINELYIVSDMLITDYSSVLFDFANLKKPIFFYMYDIEYYKNKGRGLYVELDELPGPIIETENDLIRNIQSVEEVEGQYKRTYERFHNKYNYLDDGQASKRVIDRIVKSLES